MKSLTANILATKSKCRLVIHIGASPMVANSSHGRGKAISSSQLRSSTVSCLCWGTTGFARQMKAAAYRFRARTPTRRPATAPGANRRGPAPLECVGKAEVVLSANSAEEALVFESEGGRVSVAPVALVA